jgi:Fur family transcriptional regulator, ferric uptake regulator
MTSRLEALCLEKGLKMTGQRRVIAQVLSDADDHPDVEEVHRRAALIDQRISIATVYRTMRLLEDVEVIERVDLGDGRARYEEASADHHHHLIDTRSGRIIEFARSWRRSRNASPMILGTRSSAIGWKFMGFRWTTPGRTAREQTARGQTVRGRSNEGRLRPLRGRSLPG